MSKIIRLKEVCSKTGVSRSVIYGLIKTGNFPRQIKLSERCTGYLESEVDSWIEKRATHNRVA